MYSISIYDSEKSRGEELEKLLRYYFSIKGFRFRIRHLSYPTDIIKASGYTDIVFVSPDEKDKNAMNISNALMKINPDIFLYILSEKYDYLDAAMDIRAFRYLAHPIDSLRLFASLDIITEQPVKIEFVSHHIHMALNENEVVCIYTSGRKTYVLTDFGTEYPTTSSIKEWLKKTQSCESFVCPHYSYIVNMKYVYGFDGEVITLKCKTGKAIKIYPSQRRIGEFRNKYNSNAY